MPGLLVNYFGQGALILDDPRTVADPFYSLVPAYLPYPMVALATTATIIASQAITSGVFSLTRQAIQLGFMPRMRIINTSAMAEGQVYIPEINAMMLVAALTLTMVFKQSENLAIIYGIAVTADMFITSLMFFLITRRAWHWPWPSPWPRPCSSGAWTARCLAPAWPSCCKAAGSRRWWACASCS